jgi:hypothetical protein
LPFAIAAGAGFGQLKTPRELNAVIIDAGRVPRERRTTYGDVDKDGNAAKHGLDSLQENETDQRLGSYSQLVKASRQGVNQYKYVHDSATQCVKTDQEIDKHALS